MAYSQKAKEKVKKAKLKRKLNPNVTGARLTRLRTTNPDAYKRLRKKEAARSVTSGQEGLKPRSAVPKTGPMKARKKKPKSKLMGTKRYIGAESKTPAAKKVKKRVVTSGILHESGKGGKLSSYAKKVKSHTKRKSAGPNAVISRKGAGRKPKYGYVTQAQTGILHAGSGGKSRKALGDKQPAKWKKTKPDDKKQFVTRPNNKKKAGSKSRAFRKRLGGY